MNKEELAQQLATARATNTQIDLAPLEALTSDAQAYEIQSLATGKYQSARIGYKVGATNEGAQKMFGCDGPFYGPMFEAESYLPDCTVACVEGLMGGEAEFAFQLASDVPLDTELTTTDLISYIAAAHIAVELVGRRTIGNGLPPLRAAIGDFGANAAFIKGPAIENWQAMDLAKAEVTAHIDGELTNNGTGEAVMGNPLNSLLWLHNRLRNEGQGLRAGEWVSTGTCLGVIAAKRGSQVDIEFSGCGKFNYHLS